jgi:hypothetical protein
MNKNNRLEIRKVLLAQSTSSAITMDVLRGNRRTEPRQDAMEVEMMDVLHLSQPKTLTAVGILEAARDRVKQQLAAKSLASITCGFAEDGILLHLDIEGAV